MTIKKLQNGSDIRGVAMKVHEGSKVTLGEAEAKKIAIAFAKWLRSRLNKDFDQMIISIGMDSRITGPALKKYLIKAITSLNVSVVDCGLASTPAMFMSTIFKDFSCDGSIMITASHLPFERNGFKFFTRDGGLNKENISEILQIAESISVSHILGSEDSSDSSSFSGSNLVKTKNLMDKYSEHLRSLIIKGVENGTKPLSNMKIIVDAGNGSGGFFAEKVLEPLGASTEGSLFLNPDGTFPNHQPNPENKVAMEFISKAVIQNNAHLGIIFDTDVDRSSAVDQDGNPIGRNQLIALASSIIAQEHPNTTIVTDSVTSTHLTYFIENTLGLRHLRFKRGYKNVIDKAIELNQNGIDSQLAMETSGHGAFKENFFLDDGAYTAVKIIIMAARLYKNGENISSLIKGLKNPAEAVEIRLSIKSADFSTYGDMILDKLSDWVKLREDDGLSLVAPNYEGVRINFDQSCGNGWALLRKSLHDPILPLNIESDSIGGVSEIRNQLRSFLVEFSDIDISNL